MTQAGLVSAFWHFTGRVLIVETSVNYGKVSYIASHLLQPLPVFQHHGHYFWALYSNLQFICAFFSKITSVWGLSSFTWAILSFRQVHQTQSTHREVGLKTQQKQASEGSRSPHTASGCGIQGAANPQNTNNVWNEILGDDKSLWQM